MTMEARHELQKAPKPRRSSVPLRQARGNRGRSPSRRDPPGKASSLTRRGPGANGSCRRELVKRIERDPVKTNNPRSVLAGLGPAIHEKPLVDPRAKPGEDGLGVFRTSMDFGLGTTAAQIKSASDHAP